MLTLLLWLLPIAVIVIVIGSALTSSPTEQGTPRYTDESAGEYASRSATSGCAYFVPLFVMIGFAIAVLFVVSAAGGS